MGDNAHYIELLRNDVKNTFGNGLITVKSSVNLSDAIFYVTRKKISPSTLQRFFELITNTSYPSKVTLNILAEYVNHNSWEDFIQKHKDSINHATDSKLIVDHFGLSLFNICLKNHDFNSVLEYINLLPPSEHTPDTMHQKIAETLGVFLRNSKKGRDILLPELARTVNGREYFFEEFVDLDFLNTYFAEALEYYKKGTTIFNKSKQKQAIIFANSIQHLNLIKTNNKRAAIKNATAIQKIIPIEEVSMSALNHIYPIARYYYTQLTYLQLSKQLRPEKVDGILNNVTSTINNNTLSSKEIIFLLGKVCEGLLYCKCYHDICWLYQSYKKDIELGYKTAHAYIPLISAVIQSYEQLQKIHDFKTAFSLGEINNWSVDSYTEMQREYSFLKNKLK